MRFVRQIPASLRGRIDRLSKSLAARPARSGKRPKPPLSSPSSSQRLGLQADNGSASLPLDARRPNHLAPLLGKLDNEFAELGGRACKWFRAQIDEPRFEHGISKGGINLLIEDRDDLRRRVRGGSNAIPTARLVTRHKIADRRDIR